MRKIRVSWEYPDIYTRPDDPYMHEDFKIPVNISSQEKEEFFHALYCLSPKSFDSSIMENLIQKNPNVKKILRALRGKGLVML